MLRVKNKLPNKYVVIYPNKVIKNCQLKQIEVLSFCENVTTVNKCLKIILWGYHLCQVNPKYALVLEVPLSLKNEKTQEPSRTIKNKQEGEEDIINKTLRFDIAFYDTMKGRYTHFVEYDGHTGHYTDIKMITNDVMKERFCASLNVKLLRISSKYSLDYTQLDEWFYNFESSSSVSYFLPEHYTERNKLVEKLNI